MRWLARVAASAVVRRLTLLALAGVLAWCGMGDAHAANQSQCNQRQGTENKCTRAEAYAECEATHAQVSATDPRYTYSCNWRVDFYYLERDDLYQNCHGVGFFPCAFAHMSGGCPAGSTWSEELKQCLNAICSGAGVWQGQNSVLNPSAKGLLRCLVTTPDGWQPGDPTAHCMYTAMTLQPGQPNAGYVGWVPSGQECDGNNVQCPSGYAKGVGTFDQDTCYPVKTCEAGQVDPITGECPSPDVCPEGKEKAPDGSCRVAADNCPFGTAKAPDGSCVEDPGQCKTGTVKGNDGTCKTDSDGDGEPDEGTEHTATDSINCGSPPVCNGDQIMCLHAKQLWRIDCNTRRNANVTLDMYCNAPPVCEQVVLGDGSNRSTGCTKQEEAGLFLQWRQVCEAEKTNDALERIAENTKGVGSGCGPGTADANCDGQPDWTANAMDGLGQAGLSDPGEAGTPGDVVVEGEAIGTGGLNTTGLGYGGTCPTIPDVTINGQVLHFDTSVFCNWLKLGGQFVLIAAALLSLSIMTRGQG